MWGLPLSVLGSDVPPLSPVPWGRATAPPCAGARAGRPALAPLGLFQGTGGLHESPYTDNGKPPVLF